MMLRWGLATGFTKAFEHSLVCIDEWYPFSVVRNYIVLKDLLVELFFVLLGGGAVLENFEDVALDGVGDIAGG